MVLLAKVSLYIVDFWVCSLVNSDGDLMRGGVETGFADFGTSCVMLAGVWFIGTLSSDAGIYFVGLGCTLGFLAGLWVSLGLGVSSIVFGNFGGVSCRNSFAMSIIALVVLFPYVKLGILSLGDWRMWIISDAACLRYISAVKFRNETCWGKIQQCQHHTYLLWKVCNTCSIYSVPGLVWYTKLLFHELTNFCVYLVFHVLMFSFPVVP